LEPSIKTVRCRLQALTLEQRIRTRADELWREDGSLEGCADEYWRLARRLIELEVANESAVNETPRCLTALVRTQQTELLPLFNSTQRGYAALMDGTGDCFEASCGTGAALAMCTPSRPCD
jgi:hypothetical protein